MNRRGFLIALPALALAPQAAKAASKAETSSTMAVAGTFEPTFGAFAPFWMLSGVTSHHSTDEIDILEFIQPEHIRPAFISSTIHAPSQAVLDEWHPRTPLQKLARRLGLTKNRWRG